MKKKCLRFRRKEIQFLITSTARSNYRTYVHTGNSGKLYSRQAKINVNLQECFAARSKVRLSYKMNTKLSIDENTSNYLALLKRNHRNGSPP